MDDSSVIFQDDQGRVLTHDDLQRIGRTGDQDAPEETGIPEEARRLHQQGREAGGSGEYEAALKLFEQAHQLAPDWPYPLYDAAFTYLLNEDTARAEEYYARVDRMSPRGFFTAKAALDSLRREREGMIPKGSYRMLMLLEYEGNRGKKHSILKGILSESPKFPVAWKEMVTLLDKDEEKVQAVLEGLQHDPDPDTRGMLLITRALLVSEKDERNKAIEILGGVALDPESTIACERLAKMLLTNLLSSTQAGGAAP
jgi:tetratricopeptide (TPR) repeat protein